ncbi:2,3-bisphosphoglycerate-independent phosphoglycerate mutase [bacterium]|nr:2,3-bisphosphoglycerate-independent phosphoglycerate mutase [bacterium]MBT5015399.1 2,3-bisphosphoglycerate-independent phosphoglycerate mutase [bacterium]
MKNNPTLLIILDGYGYSESTEHNAVAQADTPHLHNWFKNYPHALLQASGSAVGLVDGVMGNSEVGHMTIGAGEILPQPLTILNTMVQTHSLDTDQTLTEAYNTLNNADNSLHIIGLLSDAGVHAHIDHMVAFVKSAIANRVKRIYVHVILDGRDVPPQSALLYLDRLQKELDNFKNVQIASVHGRFYAMDRDNNSDRIEESLSVLFGHVDPEDKDAQAVVEDSYLERVTDEFIVPTLLTSDGVIRPGDGVIFCNFRADRARQLTKGLLDTVDLSFFVTPVQYHPDLATISLIERPVADNTLLEQLTKDDLSIFTIAETEKYAHVTYFFNNGREDKYDNEVRVLVPSIKIQDYTKEPCMSAKEITEIVLDSLETNPKDFYIINFANADMVGHSGNFDATKKALECLDSELEKLFEQAVTKMDGTMYITSDHGNAEVMYDNESRQPATSHTTSPVPFMMLKKTLANKPHTLPLSGLKDIASFIIKNIKD